MGYLDIITEMIEILLQVSFSYVWRKITQFAHLQF